MTNRAEKFEILSPESVLGRESVQRMSRPRVVINRDAIDRIADLVVAGVRLDALENSDSEDVAEVVAQTIQLTIQETATEIVASLIEAGVDVDLELTPES